ncbi:MAG: Twin-arginine translocation protein TatC [Ignavibacteriae bacterium]|nr:MAG: Twin-arginine translocation protein TatC [Ignavibacteriota bacterium]
MMRENKNTPAEIEEKEMTFLDHLEELRWRIIKILIGIIIGAVICWIFIDFIVNQILISPVNKINIENPSGPQIRLQNLKPFGQILLYMEITIIGGVLFSLPNFFYQLWKFIAPGLLPRERKYISSIVIFSTFCFIAGVLFAYFIMLPLALKFFAGFGTAQIENNIAITEYMSFIISMMLGAGVVFELPMVSWFLAKLGILTPKFMRKYRRHAIILILILAAILSPGTDPVSQIILAVPLFLLYEVSIFIAAVASKKKQKADE